MNYYLTDVIKQMYFAVKRDVLNALPHIEINANLDFLKRTFQV